MMAIPIERLHGLTLYMSFSGLLDTITSTSTPTSDSLNTATDVTRPLLSFRCVNAGKCPGLAIITPAGSSDNANKTPFFSLRVALQSTTTGTLTGTP